MHIVKVMARCDAVQNGPSYPPGKQTTLDYIQGRDPVYLKDFDKFSPKNSEVHLFLGGFFVSLERFEPDLTIFCYRELKSTSVWRQSKHRLDL